MIKTQLKSLGMENLLHNWDNILSSAQKEKLSYHRFLTNILSAEHQEQKEKQRVARIKRAVIPEVFVMETFPFQKQSKLKKKLVMEIYDSMSFMAKPQRLVFIGPTGCGKTGLGTAYLVHALNRGYRGCFIDFRALLARLWQSVVNHSEKKVMDHFCAYDILLIDEMGYGQVTKEKAGLFFELLKQRHRKGTTIITTQLGFNEWCSGCLNDTHITSAILDRISENCTVFNMKECISLRSKNIIHAASNE